MRKNRQQYHSNLYSRHEATPTKSGFSLIEVIIAAGILSVTVFWVYKLIWENSKLMSNSSNYVQLQTLFPALWECINSLQVNTIHDFFVEPVWYTTHFDFGADLTECNISSSNSQRVVVDNIEYALEWKIVQNNAPDSIDWVLIIEWSGVWKETQNFTLIK